MAAALLYVLAVLSANLTATLFIPLQSLAGSGILISVGTLIFGITFTQRDRIHHHGRPFVYRTIVISAVLSLALLVSCRFLWGLPLGKAFSAHGLDWLAEATFMLQDSGVRVFAASFLAIIIAESANTEVYQYFRQKSWYGRVTRSNAASIPIDSILFNLIAFAGSPFFPAAVLVKVILGEIVTKFIVSYLYAVGVKVTGRVESVARMAK